MHEKSDHDALRNETELEHFTRAVVVAEQMGLPEEEIRKLRCKALGQMSAIYRNAHGTKYLAQQYGFPRDEVRKTLEDLADN
jgi:hypothetical protein